MSWGNQGWKARKKVGSGTIHVNSKKGVTFSSSVNVGSKKTGGRYTVSADAGLPWGYVRIYETLKVNGAWKRRSKVQRTLIGLLFGRPAVNSKEYRALKRKKK